MDGRSFDEKIDGREFTVFDRRVSVVKLTEPSTYTGSTCMYYMSPPPPLNLLCRDNVEDRFPVVIFGLFTSS